MDELIKIALAPEKLTVSALIAMLSVGVWRLYVNFKKDDSVSKAENDLRDDLLSHNRELIQRADKAASEAVEAARREGAINGQLAALRGQVGAYARRCPYNHECGIKRDE